MYFNYKYIQILFKINFLLLILFYLPLLDTMLHQKMAIYECKLNIYERNRLHCVHVGLSTFLVIFPAILYNNTKFTQLLYYF